jgi:hypothetical protein
VTLVEQGHQRDVRAGSASTSPWELGLSVKRRVRALPEQVAWVVEVDPGDAGSLLGRGDWQ